MAENVYIERDELESRIKKYVKCRNADRETLEWAKDECIRQAHCMPAADVVEVVRCKDCKHWRHETDGMIDHYECAVFCGCYGKGYLTGADDFCSYGERKEK